MIFQGYYCNSIFLLYLFWAKALYIINLSSRWSSLEISRNHELDTTEYVYTVTIAVRASVPISLPFLLELYIQILFSFKERMKRWLNFTPLFIPCYQETKRSRKFPMHGYTIGNSPVNKRIKMLGKQIWQVPIVILFRWHESKHCIMSHSHSLDEDNKEE